MATAVMDDPNATATQGLKQPALPVAPTPKAPVTPGVATPPGASTLPVAGAPPVGTSDPMAFAPVGGSTDANYGSAPGSGTGYGNPPGGITVNNAGGLPPNSGGPPPGAGGPGGPVAPSNPLVNPFDPATNGGHNPMDALNGLTGGTPEYAAALAKINAGTDAYNANTANSLVNDQIATDKSLGGTFSSPEAESNFKTGQLALNGVGPNGTNNGFGDTGATASARAIDQLYGGGGVAGTANPIDTGASRFTVNGINQGNPSTPTPPVQVNGKAVTPGSSVPSSIFGGPGSTAPGTLPVARPGFTPPSHPSDVGPGGSTSNPANPPTLPVAGTSPVATTPTTTAANGATLGAPNVGKGVALTPTTPDNALTNSTISVDPSVDRFGVAKQQLADTIKNTLDPAFAANARTVGAESFGAGRGVSGMNRTAEGNLASDQANTEAQLASSFLNPALTGTIGDAQSAAALAAQQQGVQIGQQQTAFGENLTAQQLADSENNQSFQQALQQALVGSQGDPVQLQLQLAALLSGQSATNTAAASTLAKSAVG